jgi:hypothetical protein
VGERDAAGLTEIAALVRIDERLVRRSVQLAPTRRPPPVQGEQLRVATIELPPQEIAEQMVVAVPLAVIVDRHDEGVRPSEGLERRGRVGRAEHRIAQGRRHALEDRCPEQEALEMLGLALQHLLQQVVGGLGLIARQSSGPGAGIVTAAQRERRQHDRGGPPLRPLAQRLGRLR